MKRIITLLLIMSVFALNAKNIDVETAQVAGTNFLNINASQVFSSNFDELWLEQTFYDQNGNACLYVFNFDEGFVMVSAEDCAHPILAYSTENQFDTENIPDGMRFFIGSFTEQIQYGIENRLVATEDIANQWDAVLTTGDVSIIDDAVVEQLLASTWNQDNPYNMMCPEDASGPGGHVYAGCTATATSMVMHYWAYPETGQGTHSYTPHPYPTQSVNYGATTYEWSKMPNTLNGATMEQKEAVALLQWHVGVALESGYGATGTGAMPSDIPSVLRNYYSYSNDADFTYYGWKDGDRDSWHNRCRENLDALRPIQYSGWTPDWSGHAFVCDGYDSNDMFHFNFGWSGTGNGYYALDAITVQGYQFSYQSAAVFDIHPEGERYHVRATTQPENAGVILGEGSYEPDTQCTLSASSRKHYTFLNWTIDGEIVSTDSIYSFNVTENQPIVANFHREPVTITLEATPEEGGTVEGAGTYPHGDTVTITAIPSAGYRFVKWKKGGAVVSKKETYSFVASIDKTYTAYFELLDDVEENAEANVNVYPNPAKDVIYIEGINGHNVQIFNALGQIINENENVNENKFTVNVSNYGNGVYFVKIGETVKKVVIQR